MSGRRMHWLLALALSLPSVLPAATLAVGPDKQYKRIEDAAARARPGDTIDVFPRQDGEPYEQVAVFVRHKEITFRGRPGKKARYVKLSGKGFAYSGVGSIPRAIFQFNKGTDNCVLEGFELFGAHNESHNGAGVRVNQANHVTVRQCHIHNNDMGVMSNGDGTQNACVDLLVESCVIDHNGDPGHPGYNHNFYLGGTSVSLRFCDIHSSLTGHNVKSRAHYTRVEYCYVHDSCNREFDLVDAQDTTAPESHAVLLGNIIVKDAKCRGNKAVIHFGQDGGKEHDGTIYLIHNTIVTPFISPVVDLSAPKAKARFVGNIISDGGKAQQGQALANARNGASLAHVTGLHNWFSGGFSKAEGVKIDWTTCTWGPCGLALFADPDGHDYRVSKKVDGIKAAGLAVKKIAIPPTPGVGKSKDKPLAWQYVHPAAGAKRNTERKPTLGAYASK